MSSKIASAAPGLIVLVLIGYGAVHIITGSSTPAKVITPEQYKESADMEMTNFSNDLLGGHPDKSRECHILRDAANYYQRAGDQKDYDKAIGFQATLCEWCHRPTLPLLIERSHQSGVGRVPVNRFAAFEFSTAPVWKYPTAV